MRVYGYQRNDEGEVIAAVDLAQPVVNPAHNGLGFRVLGLGFGI